ncbi:MAG TPA: hypothetical protein VK638_22570 [Edaphobacter sp.]|nr:hypothetical protein [Edaphobacter sp.]
MSPPAPRSSPLQRRRKLDGTGYGDLAYLLPQDAGGFAIDAVVGDLGLNIAYAQRPGHSECG